MVQRLVRALVLVLSAHGCSGGDDGSAASAGTSSGQASGDDAAASSSASTGAPASDTTAGESSSGSAMPTTSDPGSTSAADDTTAAASSTGDTGDGVVTFDEVHPVFAAHCGPCHSGGSFGGHQIAAADIEHAYETSQQSAFICDGLTVGACTIVRIQAGEMPDGAGCSGDPRADAGMVPCLDQAEQDLVQAWIDDGQLPPA